MAQMQGGFQIMTPDVPQGVAYQISGDNCQILSMTLSPGEKISAEPGSMLFMAPEIKPDAVCTCSCQRACTGESCVRVDYENEGSGQGYIGLTPNFPAKVVPVDLSAVNGAFVTKSGAYFSQIGNVDVKVDCDCCSCTCCCGGMGMVRQSLAGDGTAFLAAGGTIMEKVLADGETMIIDTNSVVGYEESAKMGVRTAGGCLTCCCGGEGLFNTTITGPGRVIVQSMSFEKFAAALAPRAAGRPGDGAEAAGGAA